MKTRYFLLLSALAFTVNINTASAGLVYFCVHKNSGDARLVSGTGECRNPEQEITLTDLTGESCPDGEFATGVSSMGDLECATAGPTPGVLVINEVDYDQPSTDTTEFVELKNNGSDPLALNDFRIEFVNGNGNSVYDSYDLGVISASLNPGDYLVIGSQLVLDNVPAGVPSALFPDLTNNIQNGSPDGIRIVRISDGSFVDGLSYEGDISGVVEGTSPSASDPSTGDGSLARCPDGTDTNNNNADFVLVTTLTPGAVNSCN
jgi:hypothetical protein